MNVRQERLCLDCGDAITGRTDKKFCSDQCRNNYNNQQNRDETNYMRNVNNILRRNRRILKELNPAGKNRVPVKKLVEKGFDFGHCTSVLSTKAGNTYHFCYEYGYLLLDDDSAALVIRDA